MFEAQPASRTMASADSVLFIETSVSRRFPVHVSGRSTPLARLARRPRAKRAHVFAHVIALAFPALRSLRRMMVGIRDRHSMQPFFAQIFRPFHVASTA